MLGVPGAEVCGISPGGARPRSHSWEARHTLLEGFRRAGFRCAAAVFVLPDGELAARQRHRLLTDGTAEAEQALTEMRGARSPKPAEYICFLRTFLKTGADPLTRPAQTYGLRPCPCPDQTLPEACACPRCCAHCTLAMVEKAAARVKPGLQPATAVRSACSRDHQSCPGTAAACRQPR